jgi:excisionase family DNA binding protein
MGPETVTAEELAERLGTSPWSIYQAVRRGECPVPPIRVGRRIVFAKTFVDQLLGAEAR